MALLGLLFWIAIVAAVVDWRYMRGGGTRPTSADYHGLGYAAILLIVASVVLVGLGANADAIGELFVLMFMLITVLWEFRRWRIRRAHPIGRP